MKKLCLSLLLCVAAVGFFASEVTFVASLVLSPVVRLPLTDGLRLADFDKVATWIAAGCASGAILFAAIRWGRIAWLLHMAAIFPVIWLTHLLVAENLIPFAEEWRASAPSMRAVGAKAPVVTVLPGAWAVGLSWPVATLFLFSITTVIRRPAGNKTVLPPQTDEIPPFPIDLD